MTDKQPVYILPENVQRMLGRDAQRNNIMAAKIVADIVKTTLGPKGMDKMLVSGTGDITVTNDGVTILREMEVEHPAAKMMVDIAKTQDKEVGDGTTTAVIIAGKLLENAEELLNKKIHPTVIVNGYRKASEKAQELLKELSIRVVSGNDALLKSLVKTSITGKGAESFKEKFAEIIVKAVKQINRDGKVDLDNIKTEKIKGGGVEETSLIEGVIFDKTRINQEMPEMIKNARIALIDAALEVKNPGAEAKISITSPEQLEGFIEREERMIRNLIEKIQQVGANVVFCQKGVDDIAQYYLSRAGIYACRRVSKSDLEKIARATGGKIVSNINELSSDQLGIAEFVEEIKQSESEDGERLTAVRGCKNPGALTILIRGGTEHIVDEVERAIKDGLNVVAAAIKDGVVVAGGGAIEIEIAKRLREYSHSFSGREQLAVEKFAEALESIPIILAENAGIDPIEALTELKSRHEAGFKNHGLNLLGGKSIIEDNAQAGVLEPTRIKVQAINSASEVAMMILRIDDVIAASPSSSERQMSRMPDFSEVE